MYQNIHVYQIHFTAAFEHSRTQIIDLLNFSLWNELFNLFY